MFSISDKVVCVNDRFGWVTRTTPVRGVIYVVTGYMPSDQWVPAQGMPGSDLAVCLVGLEGGWNPCRFRKLDEIKAENAAKQEQEAPAPSLTAGR